MCFLLHNNTLVPFSPYSLSPLPLPPPVHRFDAMNRASFKPNSSPFLQMSFETTMDFLTTACTENATDSLTTPSSSIVLGQVVKCGTGAFELRQPLSL